MKLRVLDLFSGAAGGWSLGMHRAGFQTVAACEIDTWRRAVFSANNPGVVMYSDVRELSAARLVSDLGYLPNIIVGSPPCQDASAANSKGKGVDGERTGLFFEAIRLVRECRPAWCCFENSPHLRTRGVDRVLSELEAAGYASWPFVVGAGDIGAPHQRKRMWLISADALQAKSIRRTEDGGRVRRQEETAEINDCVTAREQVGRTGLAWADDWAEWNGGLDRYLRVGDGLSPKMARQCMSAYGDAVLPQIPELVGRAILEAMR